MGKSEEFVIALSTTGMGWWYGFGTKHCQTHGYPDLNLSIYCFSQL